MLVLYWVSFRGAGGGTCITGYTGFHSGGRGVGLASLVYWVSFRGAGGGTCITGILKW